MGSISSFLPGMNPINSALHKTGEFVGDLTMNTAINIITFGYNPAKKNEIRAAILSSEVNHWNTQEEMKRASMAISESIKSILVNKIKEIYVINGYQETLIFQGIQQTILGFFCNFSERAREKVQAKEGLNLDSSQDFELVKSVWERSLVRIPHIEDELLNSNDFSLVQSNSFIVVPDQEKDPTQFLMQFVTEFLNDIFTEKLAQQLQGAQSKEQIDGIFYKIVSVNHGKIFPMGVSGVELPLTVQGAMNMLPAKFSLDNLIIESLSKWLSDSYQQMYTCQMVKDDFRHIAAEKFIQELLKKTVSFSLGKVSSQPILNEEKYPLFDKALRNFLSPNFTNLPKDRAIGTLKEYLERIYVHIMANVTKNASDPKADADSQLWVSNALLALAIHLPKELENIYDEHKKGNLSVTAASNLLLNKLFSFVGYENISDLPVPKAFQEQVVTIIKPQIEKYLLIAFEILKTRKTVCEEGEELFNSELQGLPVLKLNAQLSGGIVKTIFSRLSAYGTDSEQIDSIIRKAVSSLSIGLTFDDDVYHWLVNEVQNILTDKKLNIEGSRGLQSVLQEILVYIEGRIVKNSPQLKSLSNGGDPQWIKKTATNLLNRISSSLRAKQESSNLPSPEQYKEQYKKISENLLKLIWQKGSQDLPMGNSEEKENLWNVLVDNLQSILTTSLETYTDQTKRNVFLINLLRNTQAQWQGKKLSEMEVCSIENNEVSTLFLRKEIKKTITFFMHSLIFGAWNRAHLRVEDFIRTIGGERAITIKRYTIDTFAHFICITVLATILSYLLSPIKKAASEMIDMIIGNVVTWINKEENHQLILDLLNDSIAMFQGDYPYKDEHDPKKIDDLFRYHSEKVVENGLNTLIAGSSLERVISRLAPRVSNTVTDQLVHQVDNLKISSLAE